MLVFVLQIIQKVSVFPNQTLGKGFIAVPVLCMDGVHLPNYEPKGGTNSGQVNRPS